MASLTPQKDASATVYGAMKAGFVSGGLAGEALLCAVCRPSCPAFSRFRRHRITAIPSSLGGEASFNICHCGRMCSFVSSVLICCPSPEVYAALKYSPKFVKGTNWQSRTAMIIMVGVSFRVASCGNSPLLIPLPLIAATPFCLCLRFRTETRAQHARDGVPRRPL